MCVYLRLKYPIRSGEVHLFPTAFMCCWLGLQFPAPLHPLLSLKKWKTVWLLWKSNYKNKYVYFQFISPPIPACSPQALASLLAATASHYLNSEFLSGFSQFSHTFNLWQNEWWLLSIKKKKNLWQAYSAHRWISFPWRWGFPLCHSVTVWWGLTGSVGAEIGCSRDRG